MNKYLFLSLLTVAACNSPSAEGDHSAANESPTTAATPVIDQKNGFRELQLGQLRSSIPNLVELPGREYLAIKDFQKSPAHENLQVGNAQIHDITYGFYKDRLVRVTLTAKGPEADKLLNAAKDLYGEPVTDKQTLPPARTFWWIGNKVLGTYMETGREGKLGYLVISDKKQVELADNSKNTAGGADL